MRFWALAILCAMIAGLVGCSNFGKKSATPNNPPVRGTPQTAAPVTPTGSSGILAGQVLDSFNRTPIAATYIQVSEAGEAGKSTAPIEVATDNHGYFMIQRLQPGHHYQLTARMKQGERLLAGTAFATPPNPKILIQISEDFATKQTPDPPGAPKFPSSPPKNSIPSPEGPPVPAWPDQVGGTSVAPNSNGINSAPPPTPPDQAWAPGNVPRNDPYINGAGRQGGAELGPPSGVFGSPPPSPTPVPQGSSGSPGSPSPVILRPEGIVKENSQVRADPLVEIPHQGPQPQVMSVPVPPGPARIPSCVLTGNTLYNFALYDLNGQPWEFRHHQGRLVLIDFWGTWCSHCLVSVKDLNALQDRYGRYGLEVIGIDYEGDASPQDQVLKVRGARTRYGMNYRILLGGNQDTCPVRAQFGVRNFPSAFLIDESNHVIWSSEGLGRQQVRELEIIIRQRLGLR